MESKHKLSINQWALEDRPREKMMEKGAAALSDAELLAILIGSGNTEESAVELMRRLRPTHRGIQLAQIHRSNGIATQIDIGIQRPIVTRFPLPFEVN